MYNFLDFTADRPSLDVYDVSPCFSDNDKLKFRVRFPGKRIMGNLFKIHLDYIFLAHIIDIIHIYVYHETCIVLFTCSVN